MLRSLSPLVLVVVVSFPSGQAHAGRIGGIACRQWSEARATLRSPARVARMAGAASLGGATGLLSQHFGVGYPAAVFLSYTTSEVADRIIQRYAPATRSLTPDTRSHFDFAWESLTVAALAGGSASVLQTSLALIAHTLLGRVAPSMIGVGAGAFFPRTLVRGTLSLGAGLVATTARSAMDGVRGAMRVRHERVVEATKDDVLP